MHLRCRRLGNFVAAGSVEAETQTVDNILHGVDVCDCACGRARDWVMLVLNGWFASVLW